VTNHRSFRLLAICIGLLAAGPAAATSVFEPLAFVNWRTDPATGAVGVGAAIGVASLDVVPAYEHVFADNATDWAMDVDVHVPLMALPVVAFYAGAGIAYYKHAPDSGGSSSDSGVDLLVGAKATVHRLKPFAEIRYTTAGPDGVTIMIGSRFNWR
jgi:hypothetical protein